MGHKHAMNTIERHEYKQLWRGAGGRTNPVTLSSCADFWWNDGIQITTIYYDTFGDCFFYLCSTLFQTSPMFPQVANPFKHQREHCQKDFVAKKVQGILNRITPEKYETLSQQLVDLIAPHMAEESESTTEICKEV